VAGGGYYLFVGMKFYGKEVKDFLSGKGVKEVGANTVATPAGRGNGVDQIQVPDFSEGGQPALFGSEDEMGDGTQEMFKAMEKVIALLKEVMNQGAVRKIGREELLDQFTEVLRKYRQLKGTHYQLAVNNFLVRTCSSNFSLVLGENELEVLWK